MSSPVFSRLRKTFSLYNILYSLGPTKAQTLSLQKNLRNNLRGSDKTKTTPIFCSVHQERPQERLRYEMGPGIGPWIGTINRAP